MKSHISTRERASCVRETKFSVFPGVVGYFLSLTINQDPSCCDLLPLAPEAQVSQARLACLACLCSTQTLFVVCFIFL